MKQQSLKRGNWRDDPCFYVSVRDAEKYAFLLGPFRREADCRKWAYIERKDGGDSEKHLRLMNLCNDLDPKSAFYGFGMAKAPDGHREGSLNVKLNLTNGEMYGGNDQVINDALMLSSGTICTLTGETRYAEIEKIQTAFVVWLQQSDQKFDSWVDAWTAYQVRKQEG